MPRGLLISSVLLLVLGYESPVLVIRAYWDFKVSSRRLDFIIIRAEISLIWLAFGENFLLNGICQFFTKEKKNSVKF